MPLTALEILGLMPFIDLYPRRWYVLPLQSEGIAFSLCLLKQWRMLENTLARCNLLRPSWEGRARCLPSQRLLHFHKGGGNQPSLANQPGAKRAKLFWEMRDKQARKPYRRFVLTCKGIFFDERIQTVVCNVLSAQICFQRDLPHTPCWLTKSFCIRFFSKNLHFLN